MARIEHDSLGAVPVPDSALYGAQTQRAVENFTISGLRMPERFLRALGRIKAVAAEVNGSLGEIDAERAAAMWAANAEYDGTNVQDEFTGEGAFVAYYVREESE